MCSKYGNAHRQIRALVILDDLIQNAGPGFQRQFADEMLLERLRFMVTDPLVDSDVKTKCSALYRQWAVSYKSTPGMQNIATLYKQLPQRKRAPNKETSKVLRETERPDETEDEEDVEPRRRAGSASASSAPSGHRRQSSATDFHSSLGHSSHTSPTYTPPVQAKSKKDKKPTKSAKVKAFNFEKEKPQINQVITLASIEATGLLNALKLINRERERVSENANTKRRFETCKGLRRQTFRYCSLVMDESYLGTLLNANDQLSDALIMYEQLDRSFDYDSDSEDYDDPDVSSAHAAQQGHAIGITSPTSAASVQSKMAGLSLGNAPPVMPPRPPTLTATSPDGGKGKLREEPEDDYEDEEDENDPFADRNAVNTPRVEKDEPTW